MAIVAVALEDSGSRFVSDWSTSRSTTAARTAEPARSTSSDTFNFSFLAQSRALPQLQFVDDDGHTLSLDNFRGKPILLNIWATWCIPCREEMPALDRLQATIGKSQLLVLPLSIDRQGVPVVKKFYQELGLETLGIYVDPSGKASSILSAVGVPTTLLVDRDGQEVGRKIGAAEWDSPEMIALIREHVGLPSSAQGAAP